jgi:hypothetical protein
MRAAGMPLPWIFLKSVAGSFLPNRPRIRIREAKRLPPRWAWKALKYRSRQID